MYEKAHFDEYGNMILWQDLDWVLTVYKAEQKKNDFDESIKNAIVESEPKQN